MNISEILDIVKGMLCMMGILGIICMLHYIRKMKYKKTNKIAEIKDEAFLKIYSEIESGYKVKYRETKIPLLSALVIILSIIFILFFIVNNKITLTLIICLTSIIILFFTYGYVEKQKTRLNINNGNKCEYHLIERLGKIFIPDFKELDKDLLYEEGKKVYSDCKLCNSYDKFYLYDCFGGTLKNNANFKIYNICTRIRSNNYSKYKDAFIVFSGIIMKVELDFNINGYLKITRDNLIKFKKDLVVLDSSEFEKNFDVISNNKMISMQLLTSDFMDKLNLLLDKYNFYFKIYIINNEMYIKYNEHILNNPYPLKKPELNETYMNYCKLKHLLTVCNLFYDRLNEIK